MVIGNPKRMKKIKFMIEVKRIIIFSAIILLPFLIWGKDKKEPKFTWEFSSGYSFGFSNPYKLKEEYWRIPPLSLEDKYFERMELRFPIRLGVQYYLSKNFVLKSEIEYQNRIWHRWGGSSEGYIEIKRDESFVVPYFNIVYLFRKEKRIIPYIEGGIGVPYLIYFIPIPMLKGECGLKYLISSNIYLFLGFSIHSSISERGNHFSVRIGFEYY